MDTTGLQLFLDVFGQQAAGERVGVVRDGSEARRSAALVWPDDLVPLALPPYSPELNPAGRIFELLRAKLANRIFADLTELEDALTQHLQGFWAETAVVRSLTDHGWWLARLETIHSSSP